MNFMADVSMTCPECNGARYRPDVLEARYRGLSIADVLAMTADDAFMLFRGKNRVQKKLKVLRDTGLGYLPLGQPATTLSGGEAQRLKMASHLASLASKATRQTASDKFATLFLLDEPSVGLHGSDVAVLLKCFDALLDAGHSLIVVEHNKDIISAADHIIDLGPGAGANGGQIVVAGTPGEVIAEPESLTGRLLRGEL
jgi:excinuclease ABC subunit A